MMRKIVSLTSYGARLSETLPTTLESIYSMNGFEPDYVLLYLTESDYELLDKNLLLKYDKLSVRIVEDVKSFKKYYALTESEFEDDLIFIADDDISYNPDTWQKLNSLYEKNKSGQYIYTSRILAYEGNYSKSYLPKENGIYDRFLVWSGFGLLIPPKILRFDENKLKEWFEYENKGGLNYINDDIFLSVYCLKENIKCICACIQHQYLDFNDNQKFADALRGKTKYQMNLVFKYFEMPYNNIVVSLSVSDTSQIYNKITLMFNEQTLKPDKVVLCVAENTKLTKKVLNLQNEYNFEIQYTDLNPKQKKWFPEGMKENDLLFVIDGDSMCPEDLLMCLYSKYNNDNVLTLGKKLVLFKGYGHQYILFDKGRILKTDCLAGLEYDENNFLAKATETILKNGFFVKPY